jgi:ABC-type multidrug transport system fused ATPase/permease subunit
MNLLLHRIKESSKNVLKMLLIVGRFLRIIDERDDQLSVVNIACIVVIVKVALVVNPSMVDLGTLLIALLAHYGKKRINTKVRNLDTQQNKQLEEVQGKLKELGDRVGGVAAALGFKNLK